MTPEEIRAFSLESELRDPIAHLLREIAAQLSEQNIHLFLILRAIEFFRGSRAPGEIYIERRPYRPYHETPIFGMTEILKRNDLETVRRWWKRIRTLVLPYDWRKDPHLAGIDAATFDYLRNLGEEPKP